MWNECLAPKLVDESDEFDELEVVEKIIVLLKPIEKKYDRCVFYSHQISMLNKFREFLIPI
jgi:hypothetical protein